MAIELAASRVKMLQPAQIASRLDECFKILSGGPADALAHHQTLELAIDWSYDMLDQESQLLFRQLSVFRGGFTLDACGAVMGTEDEFEALDALGDLVDKSLVRTMPSREETRYSMLEPLRQYAAARITGEEGEQAGGSHARHFQQLAEEAEPELRGPQGLEWLAKLETEHDNLRAALSWGLEVGDADLPQRTVASLTWFWIIRRHMAEAVEWFDRALAAEGGSAKARASALVQSGFKGLWTHDEDVDQCMARIVESQALFEGLGDEQGIMVAQTHEATIIWYLRDLEASNLRFAEIQVGHQAHGFEWGDALCSWWLGSAACLVGDMSLAHEHYSRCLEMFRRTGDLALTAWTLFPLANISLGLGELDRSIALYDECLSKMGDLGDRHGAGAVLMGLGMTAHIRGDAEAAQRFLAEAQIDLREGGGGQNLSWPISNVMVDTHTREMRIEATRRYQNAVNLPPEEWVRMVLTDGEAWRARANI